MNKGEGKRMLAVLLYESRSQFRFWGTGRLSIDPYKTIYFRRLTKERLEGKNHPPSNTLPTTHAVFIGECFMESTTKYKDAPIPNIFVIH
jgi:hypothetical protein